MSSQGIPRRDLCLTLVDEIAAHTGARLEQLNVEQYHQMIEDGILLEGSPVELLEGLLVQKDRGDVGWPGGRHSPQHVAGLHRLWQHLKAVCPQEKCHLRMQVPLTCGLASEPEPDVALVRGDIDQYWNRHPSETEAILVCEVAGTSLHWDRTTKQRIYAMAGVPAYWVVNLVERIVEVYEQPLVAEGRYATRVDYRAGQEIVLSLPESAMTCRVVVSEILK